MSEEEKKESAEVTEKTAAEAIIEKAKPAEEVLDEDGTIRKAEEEKPEDKTAELLAALEKENEELKAKVDILKNEYARAYADTENIKKRLYKENETKNKYRAQSFALEILPVLDNCERALAVETADENYRKGFEMVYKLIVSALKKEGVEEIIAQDEPFDPNWHQAMMSEHAEGVAPGTVIQVLQKGYRIKDRLLRAAMVKISE